MTHAQENSQGHPSRVSLDADQPYREVIARLGGEPVRLRGEGWVDPLQVWDAPPAAGELYCDPISGHAMADGQKSPTQIILGAVGRGKSSTEEGGSRG